MTEKNHSWIAQLLMGAGIVGIILTPVLGLAAVTKHYGLAGLAIAGASIATLARLIFWVLLPAPVANKTCGLESFECTYAELAAGYSHVPWTGILIVCWTVAAVTVALTLIAPRR